MNLTTSATNSGWNSKPPSIFNQNSLLRFDKLFRTDGLIVNEIIKHTSKNKPMKFKWKLLYNLLALAIATVQCSSPTSDMDQDASKMKNTSFLVLVVSLLFFACKSDTKSQHVASTFKANGKDTTITFEGEQNGKIPVTWSAETSRWETSNDSTNTVLKMLSNDASAFNIAVVRNLYYQNFDIETRVKSVSGSEDQGGGLVWRYLDKNNYYIIRANPLENNIRLYKVVDGRRKQLESKEIKIQTGEWFTIKVIVNKNEIDCYYNGEKVFDSSDDTFPGAGAVGFWSKADAVSLFDDLTIKVNN
jgi:hypothetical protein